MQRRNSQSPPPIEEPRVQQKPKGAPNVLLGKERRKPKAKTTPPSETCEHTHMDDKGFMHKCFHKCRSILFSPAFWLGTTLSFPIEHYLWTKIWPFYLLSDLMGV